MPPLNLKKNSTTGKKGKIQGRITEAVPSCYVKKKKGGKCANTTTHTWRN